MFVVQFVAKDGTVNVLAFAASGKQAEDLVDKCAVQRVADRSGSERADGAYERPDGEGHYLVPGEDLCTVHVWSRKMNRAEDGWIFAGTVELVDAEVGAVRAIEFDAQALHCDSDAVVPIASMHCTPQAIGAGYRRTATTALQKTTPSPWLKELKKHPKFAFQSI